MAGEFRTFALTDWPSALQPQPKSKNKSKSPPANESHALLFITGNTPAELKSKKNMTKVRKKAMGSYLQDKKPKNATKGRQSRMQSEGSTDSRTTSVGSDQPEIEVVILNGEISKSARGKRSIDRRPSSPERPSAESQATTPETQISRVRQSIDMILPSAPMVNPSRTDVELEYDVTAPKPFQSIGKPLDPFRTMFNPNHPRISVEELKFYCTINHLKCSNYANFSQAPAPLAREQWASIGSQRWSSRLTHF